MPIRLVIADDHPIVLDGLAQLFAAERDCEVVALASSGVDALAAVRRLIPDILLLDLRMPRMDGLAVLQEQRDGDRTRVVVLTAAEDDDVFEAIRLGAQGVVLKDMALELLVRCVREVHAGRKWIEKGAATHAVETLLDRQAKRRDVEWILTPRELEVVRLIAQGHPSKIVADMLTISEGTVKLHLHHVYEKLGIDGRMTLVRYLRSKRLE